MADVEDTDPAGVVTADPPDDAELLQAATVHEFVPFARATIAELQELLAAEDLARPALQAAVRALGAQFGALEIAAPQRLCGAADQRLRSDAEPLDPATLAALVDALAATVERLADDPAGAAAATDGDGGAGQLLQALLGVAGEPIDCEPGGEYAADGRELVSALRDELVLVEAVFQLGGLPSVADRADARGAARGVAGIAAMLDLQPIVDLARAFAAVLERDLGWDDLDELESAVARLRQLVDAAAGTVAPTVDEYIAALTAVDAIAGRRPVDTILEIVVAGESLALPTTVVAEVLAPAAAVARGICILDPESGRALTPDAAPASPAAGSVVVLTAAAVESAAADAVRGELPAGRFGIAVAAVLGVRPEIEATEIEYLDLDELLAGAGAG